MKALLLQKEKQFEMTELPTPDIGSDDVLIRINSCGICGSDVHGFDGSSGRRIPPIIMGHEAAGTVERVGDQVNACQPGDRVTFDSTVYCGKCDYCRRGDINLCDNRMVLGVSCDDYRRHGAFAEYLAVPQHIVYKLPDQLSFDAAAMIEPVSVAVHAVKRLEAKAEESALVVGAGMIGLLIVQALRVTGCETIVATDIEDDRLAIAREFGATATVNARNDDTAARLIELSGGGGFDIALEALGSTPTIQSAVDALRKGGRLCLVGNAAPKIDLALQAVVSRELSLIGTCASKGEYPECMRLMATGNIDVERLITARAPLEDGASWFDRLYAREAGLIKVILHPQRRRGQSVGGEFF